MRLGVIGSVTVILALSAAGTAPIGAQGAAQGAGQAATTPAAGQKPKPLPSIAERTDGFRKLDGFYPLYWDDALGTLYLEIPRLDQEVLYVTGLSAGLGSNDIGLDRAQLGAERLVKFQRVGQKILMVQPNLDYRAISDNPAERRAVEDAFAKSVIWGFTAIAETSGRVLVDLTDFVMRDVHGVAGSLRPAVYRFDRTRSAVYMDATRAFPKNSEIDVTTTFVSDDGGRGAGPGQIGGRIADVTPSAEAVTVRQHHSFIELPDAGYKSRPFDPRSGFGSYDYVDYATPLGEPMRKQFLVRHRLEKRDPSAGMSDPVKPIIYYVDRGTPEPIRSALVEGARWWNQAFESAGYRNAFQVEVMPEGADPMDVRYNTITWIHRSTRGWSYGGSINDPRTGEIIKGHVSLGSLRIRQDYLILEGLLSPYATGSEKPAQLAEVALARIRQLSAHEVGHTLGLGHNYYNSSKGRISVLDYPHPMITLRRDGTMDLSQAYDVGIGPWDKVSIQYGYGQVPPSSTPGFIPYEPQFLQKILDDAWAEDLRYMTNQDLDVAPNVDQWNNGTDVAAELTRMLTVRRAGLERFGETAIQKDRPMAMIEEALVPLYLHHRYAVDSAVTVLGGQDYIYAMRGDGRTPVRWAPAASQKNALDALMSTLRLNELTLSSSLLGKIPPRPPGFGRTRELFPRMTGGAFDPISPAIVATDMVVSGLLTNDRAARLVAQHAVDQTLPGLDDVIAHLVTAVFDAAPKTPYEAEINRAMERVVISRLMSLAQSAPMTQVRAIATQSLKRLQTRNAAVAPGQVAAELAHRQLIVDDLKRFFERSADTMRPAETPQPPPGAPIGEFGLDYLLGIDICRIR
jgi:hypothetical protein